MAKGQKTGGRQKGVPNKITTDVRNAIVQAFEMVGGAEYLQRLAISDPKAFCTLLGKTVPTVVASDPNAPLIPNSIEIRFVGPAG